jgi:long-chain acyl-CoA synthetase
MSAMLVESLLAHAAATPDEIAVVDDTGTYSYHRLAASAAGLAKYLSSRTSAGNVGLLLPASAGFVASFYGTLLAGKSVVPINFLLGERETAHVLADSGVDTVVTIPQLAGKIKSDKIQVIDITALPKPPQIILSAILSQTRPPIKTAGDTAVLMYTSGTSGLPKGVVLTYGNLQSDVDACIEHAKLEHRHKFLGVIPLFHAFGMTAMMIAPIQLGSTVIYLARFSAVAALNAIREHKVSLMFAVPSMLAAVAHLKSAVPEDFKSIYALISGGEPLPGALREKFKDRFGLNIFEGYGLTETSPVVALNTPQMHRPGSVGRPVPGAEVRITDENGSSVDCEQTGEVWLRGPMIMKEYHNLPNESAEAITPDRFFKTGDLGKIDADGYLHITGRKKDLIIVAGEKASPREIEETLVKHPAVAEAAVVGKKDAGRGEVVVAFVIAREGMEIKADQLKEFCREHALPQWKIPREIMVVTDLPRSPTGKVLKRVLAEQVNSG